MYGCKNTFKNSVSAIVIPMQTGIQIILNSWSSALADSAGLTAQFFDKAVRRQR